MVVSFLPDDNGHSCEVHPYGCGNALIEREGNSVGSLVRLHLVEATHLEGYAVKDNGTDGCCICFAAHEYTTGDSAQLLDGSLLQIPEVFFPDSANRSIRALYQPNCGYAYANKYKK